MASLVLLAFLTLQRGVELVIAARNTRALRARGAIEFGADHYPVMVALHASWLVALWFFGYGRALVPVFVVLFVLFQAARVWVLATLGARWTTRIIVLAGAPPITTGPYRWLKHPNYAIVLLEIPCVPLALGLPWIAAIFGACNIAMLAWRIRCENAALGKYVHGAPHG